MTYGFTSLTRRAGQNQMEQVAASSMRQVSFTNWLCKTIWQQEAQAMIISSCMSYCEDGIHATFPPQHLLASVLCPEGTVGCPGGIFEVHDSATLADSEGKGHAIRLFTRNHRRDGEEREGDRGRKGDGEKEVN